MIRTYKYRLYPTRPPPVGARQQQTALSEVLEVGRQFYNYALQYRRERWQESRYAVTYNEQAAMWRDWRNERSEDNPLRLLNMSAGQQLLRRLDKAYRAFFRRMKAGENPGPPVSKAKTAFTRWNFGMAMAASSKSVSGYCSTCQTWATSKSSFTAH